MDDLDDLVGSVATTPIKRPPKRARHYPDDDTRRDVMAWVAAGIPQEAMAQLLRIDQNTLRRAYKHEIEHGMAMANGFVAGKLMGKITAGDTASILFWCKTRMGWRERGQYDAENPLVTVAAGGPVDPKALARELRDALMEMARPRLVA